SLVGSTLTTLHSFNCTTDGGSPYAGVIRDRDGNLYGAAYKNGAHSGGVVYEVSQSGTFSVLYNFCSLGDCADGRYPSGGLALGADGNLYGTTDSGGANGRGVVFELSNSGGQWQETILHSFAGGAQDGRAPRYARLTLITKSGEIFGVTAGGGTNDLGTVFLL